MLSAIFHNPPFPQADIILMRIRTTKIVLIFICEMLHGIKLLFVTNSEQPDCCILAN